MHFVILVNGLFIFAQRERETDLISFIVTYPGIIVFVSRKQENASLKQRVIFICELSSHINMVHTSFKKP